MIWGKRRPGDGIPPARSRMARATRIGLAVLLVVTLAPLAPMTQTTETAEALTQTTDYAKVFDKQQIFGSPGLITGSTMRLATTSSEFYYDDYGYHSGSCSSFVSTDEISLLHNWEVRFTGSVPTFPTSGANTSISVKFSPALTRGAQLLNTSGYVWNYRRLKTTSSDTSSMYVCAMTNAMETGSHLSETGTSWGNRPLSFSYDARTDRVTFSNGSETIALDNMRTLLGDKAYLCFIGIIEWNAAEGAPKDMELSATFNSMKLPNLDPAIRGIVLYRHNEATGSFDIPVSESDMLERNEIVLARCIIANQNTAASAGGYNEQFSMRLKLADTDDNPTQGIVPFADGDHPLQVNGKTIAVAAGPETLTGEKGVPLTLKGNETVSVTYYARVNQAGGQAVKISHELIEDTFKGKQYKTIQLLAEQPLTPGTGDDPSLTPGRDYHYTRLPAANENGWNGKTASPVAVTFYGGAGCDFDRFSVTGEGGAALAALTDADNVWRQTADVDSLAVEFQARNSGTGAVSSKGTDVIRIDTQEPALTWDADANTLTASDAAPAGSGKAESGVWKVRQVLQDRATPLASGQTNWDFTLTDGKGKAVQTISDVAPGFYVAEDAAGNVSDPVEVKDADNPDDPSGPDNPGGTDPDPLPNYPVITPKPDPETPDAPAPKPLPPAEVGTEPGTKTEHALVRHTLRQPISPEPITPSMMAGLIADRYVVSAGLGGGDVTAGAVRLFDADGNAVAAIDRSRPGTWVAEQVFTDERGNTTTFRLTVQVRENSVIGSTTNSGTDGSGTSAGDGTAGTDGHRTDLARRLGKLPQTGGVFGPCPLHGLFALMMVMASAYSLMRLRQRRRNRGAARVGRDGRDGRGVRYTAFDGFVHATVALSAIALGALSFCPWDLLWAAAVLATVAAWATLLNRPGRRRPSHPTRS